MLEKDLEARTELQRENSGGAAEVNIVDSI